MHVSLVDPLGSRCLVVLNWRFSRVLPARAIGFQFADATSCFLIFSYFKKKERKNNLTYFVRFQVWLLFHFNYHVCCFNIYSPIFLSWLCLYVFFFVFYKIRTRKGQFKCPILIKSFLISSRLEKKVILQ